MTNTPPQGERPPPASPGTPRRQVALPGGPQKKRRLGLAAVGLAMVFGSGFGFWFILRSVDQRSEYLMAARSFERWDVATAADFTVVEANVGPASALTPDRLGAVSGKWATGRIPAGTIITAGLFETPPLSSESEADRVLMEVSLPASDAPAGTLESGDTVALIGREASGADGDRSALSLIGVMQLDLVRGDSLFYTVTPGEALQIRSTIDRYNQASDRFMLKLGFELDAEDVVAALDQHGAAVASTAPALSPAPGSGFDPVEGQ